MVVYKYLLDKRGSMSSGMALVYSALLERSIMSNGEIFDCEGTFDIVNAREFIEDMTDGGYYNIDMPYFTTKWLSGKTGISQQHVRMIIKDLDRLGYINIDDCSISCPVDVLNKGFLKLDVNTGLKGWLLIDYHFMKERALRYGGKIDTYGSRLAELMHTTQWCVFKTIEKLKKKGFVERLSDGRLLIK